MADQGLWVNLEKLQSLRGRIVGLFELFLVEEHIHSILVHLAYLPRKSLHEIDIFLVNPDEDLLEILSFDLARLITVNCFKACHECVPLIDELDYLFIKLDRLAETVKERLVQIFDNLIKEV